MIVRASQSEEGACIEKALYVPMTSPAETLTEKVHLAAGMLAKWVPDYHRCEIWTSLADSDVSVLTLPVVNGEELDAVALLNASRTVKIDPLRSVFDYRVQAKVMVEGIAQQRALAVSAPTTSVSAMKEAFEASGLRLTGLTSSSFSVNGIFSAGFEKSPWQHYAVLQIENDVSVLSLIEAGTVVLLRTYNFGMRQFLSDVIDHLSLTDTGRFDEDPDQRAERLAKEAERIFSTSRANDENRRLIEEALQSNIDRAVKYIDRTFSYYERMEHGLSPEGMLFISDFGIADVIGRAVESRFGIPCQHCYMSGSVLPEVKEQAEEIREQFKTPLFFSTAGLALANSTMPNLLELPAQRRQKARQCRLVKQIRRAVLAFSAAAVLFSVWCGIAAMQTLGELQTLQEVHRSMGDAYTAQVLREETSALRALEAAGLTQLERRRAASMLAALAELRSEAIYVTSVTYQASSDQTRSLERREPSRREAPNAGLPATVTLKVSVYGNAQTRESALAEFINRLQAAEPDMRLSIQREESDWGGAAYLIRLTGRLG